MIPIVENSGFESKETNSISAKSAEISEIIPGQSKYYKVSKVRINNKWFILKQINAEYKEHPVYVSALEKEFEIGFRLDHPHIIKYYNKGKDENGTYIISEYVDGVTLRQLIAGDNKMRKNSSFIEKFIFQMTEALSYMHNQQLYHADMKPENIIITHKGSNVKIIDFGLSCTDADILISPGTKKYASPEQTESPEMLDARSDIYSFGLILLELLTGKTDKEAIRHVPKKFKNIIKKCISPSQEMRYQSAIEIPYDLKKKNINRVIYYSLFSVIIITVIFVYAFNNKSNNVAFTYNKRDILPQYKSSLYIHKAGVPDYDNSASIIYRTDSIINSITEDLPTADSVKITELASALFQCFIDKVNEYEKSPTTRSRKLEFNDYKQHCIEKCLNELAKLLQKYDKGSAIYVRLNELYTQTSFMSEQKMDSVIY